MPLSPWDLPPELQAIAKIGAKGLASGDISPADAQNNLSSVMSTPMSQEQAPMTPMSPQANTSGGVPLNMPPLSPMAPINSNPMFPKIDLSKPNAHASQTDTGKQQQSKTSKQATWISPEQYATLRDSFTSTPEMQSQKAGIDSLQDNCDRGQELQKNLPHMDWSPLLALSDSLTGSKLLSGYTPPENAQSLIKASSDQLGKLQDKKQQYAKDLLDLIKNAKSGSIQDSYLQSLTNANNAGVGSASGGAGNSARLINAISGAGNHFDNDGVIKQLVSTKNSLTRANDTVHGSAPVDAQSLYTIQNDISNAVAPGGYATDGKLRSEVLEPLAAVIANVKAKYGDKITDLRTQDPQLFGQLTKKIDQITDTYNQQGQNRIKGISQSYAHVNNPDVAATVKDKSDYYNDFFSRPKVQAPPPATPAPGSLTGGAPPAKKLTEMTNEELKDYIASHGKGS